MQDEKKVIEIYLQRSDINQYMLFKVIYDESNIMQTQDKNALKLYFSGEQEVGSMIMLDNNDSVTLAGYEDLQKHLQCETKQGNDNATQ